MDGTITSPLAVSGRALESSNLFNLRSKSEHGAGSVVYDEIHRGYRQVTHYVKRKREERVGVERQNNGKLRIVTIGV